MTETEKYYLIEELENNDGELLFEQLDNDKEYIDEVINTLKDNGYTVVVTEDRIRVN